MSIEFRDDDEEIDTSVSCSSCDAVCCRLTVLVMPEDKVPRHLIARNEHGLEVMARGEDGLCHIGMAPNPFFVDRYLRQRVDSPSIIN